MATVIGQLRVMLGLDSGQFQRGVGAAARSMQQLRSGLVTVSAAMAAVGTAAFALVSSTATAANEIARQAQIAGSSAAEFQRMAYAARTVGVEQDKLSDILKDVNDRVGEFLQTGGGPMADFFENVAPKVGVTADMFRDLSGPDALQLYVDTLEQAGLNQQEMTFYMEALAGDAAALIPLLADNGAELERLGAAADASGAIMSDRLIGNSGEFREAMAGLQGGLLGVRNEIAERLMPIFTELMIAITDNVLPSVLSMIEGIDGWIAAFRDLPVPIQEAAAAIGLALGISGPIILAIGALKIAFGGLVAASGPIGLFIAAAGILTAAWVTWGDDIKAAVGPALEWLSGKFEALSNFIQGIIDKAVAAKDAIVSMFNSAGDAQDPLNVPDPVEGARSAYGSLDPSTIPGVGGGLADGLLQGLEGGDIVERSRDVFRDISDAARDEWEIRSPSRLFARFGRYLAQGLGIGLSEGATDAAAGMQDVVEETTTATTAIGDDLDRVGDTVKDSFFRMATGAMSFRDAVDSIKSSIGNMLMQKAQGLFNTGLDTIFGSIFGGIGSNANGTDNWRGGLTWVGEEGPELVNLPRGSQVFDADTSAGMMSGGGGMVINIDARGAQQGVGEEIDAVLRRWQADTINKSVAATGRAMSATKTFGRR